MALYWGLWILCAIMWLIASILCIDFIIGAFKELSIHKKLKKLGVRRASIRETGGMLAWGTSCQVTELDWNRKLTEWKEEIT